MKVRELISRLQAVDPTGEMDCCVCNVDILSVYELPAYYDGWREELVRDPSKEPYYDVVGARFVGTGSKVQIQTHSIEDALWDNAELPVDVGGNERRGKRIESIRAEVRRCDEEMLTEKAAKKTAAR